MTIERLELYIKKYIYNCVILFLSYNLKMRFLVNNVSNNVPLPQVDLY